MSEKRVVAIIVEGPTDEIALGGVLKEYFSSEKVKFAVVHGDITSDYNTSLDEKSPNYVMKRIVCIIDDLRGKYGYHWGDFLQVIHIADTDGAFTKASIQEADVKGIRYYEDRIETKNVASVEKRNAHKATILFKLYSTGSVHDVPYRLYFNSCNLEHVLYKRLENFTDEEKEDLADEFADQYEGNLEGFLKFISDKSVAVPGTYKATWRFIEKNHHSLQRHTNMHLIFQDNKELS